MASFFYCELVKGSNSPEQERYVNIANAFNEWLDTPLLVLRLAERSLTFVVFTTFGTLNMN